MIAVMGTLLTTAFPASTSSGRTEDVDEALESSTSSRNNCFELINGHT